MTAWEAQSGEELPDVRGCWCDALAATPDVPHDGYKVCAGPCADKALIERLKAAMKSADELLAGMWSYNDDSRKALAHTWPVQASDVLRAATASPVGEAEGRADE